jgi:hypothetical protein
MYYDICFDNKYFVIPVHQSTANWSYMQVKKKIIVHGLSFTMASFSPFLCGLKSKSNEILLGVKGTAEIVKRKRREVKLFS